VNPWQKDDLIRRKYAALVSIARTHFTHSATQPDIRFGAGDHNQYAAVNPSGATTSTH
jgi:hypothetical protein